MRQVSIRELKKRLSAILAEVAAGAHVLIVRHRRPLAHLSPAELEHVHVGARFGKARIQPLFRAKTRGRHPEVLDDNRRARDERS